VKYGRMLFEGLVAAAATMMRIQTAALSLSVILALLISCVFVEAIDAGWLHFVVGSNNTMKPSYFSSRGVLPTHTMKDEGCVGLLVKENTILCCVCIYERSKITIIIIIILDILIT